MQVSFTAPAVALSHIRTGKVRALGVTNKKRSPVLPEIPAIAEFLPGYESGGFFGIGAPKATPSEIVGRLNTAINSALANPGIRARIAEMGVSPLGGSPVEFAKLIADESDKWAKVIRRAGIAQTH